MSIEATKAIQMVYANTTEHDWPDDIWDAICQAIEAEKQSTKCVTSVSEVEPVAWRREFEGDVSDLCQWLYADEYEPKDDNPNWQALYDHPQPKREPLTYETRNWIVATCPTPRHIIDAVERMHDIKGKA